ncbi:MAG TPA: serine/threonine-protein kinase [Gemmataceae bacterium]|nr:serine/threonine-protein kinase [Gemmataceae bacterium]
MPYAGAVIGPYEILETIGKGGMATVYRGRRSETGQIVAIKVMEAQYASSAVLVRRFEQEYAAACRLRHPNLVPVWDFGQEDGRPYLVMEFIDGQNLNRRIKREGPLTETEAVRTILQVADGLQAAHRLQMIHRDVKPDNVLLSKDGQAKLSDLGLVKVADNGEPLTKTRTCLGTIAFVAPEQFEDAKRVDQRADIYGLGATLYHAVTGTPPFEGKRNLQILRKKIENDFIPPSERVPSLSPWLNEAICKALDGCPDKRQSSCREFMDSLQPHSVAPAAVAAAAAPASAGDDRRRAIRYPTTLTAICRPLQAGRNCWPATIEDVSETGVRLRLERRFEPGSVLTVELPSQEPILRTLYTTVVWVREAAGRKWCVGCMFKRALLKAELETLLGDKPVTVLIHPD